MNVRISIKTYNRKIMLVSLIGEIEAYFKKSKHKCTIVLHDDCSDYPTALQKSLAEKTSYVRYENNHGKQSHWKIWDNDFKLCENEKYDLYIFIPDDVSNLNLDGIISSAEKLKQNEYFYNIINDGRTMSWNQLPPEMDSDEYMKIYFTDCAFFTNYQTLKRLEFQINEINPIRFKNKPNISSGVGQQLTNRLNQLRIDIYHPYQSYAEHGTHESKMNPGERERNPLVSNIIVPKKPIVVGVATFKGREKALEVMLDSISRQTIKPDHVFVYDNEKNVDLTDNGKFHGLTQIEDCYYFSCDDDLLYPPTYIQDMIQSIEKHKCIITHHGRKLRGENRDYYRGHFAIRCLAQNRREMELDIAGTGVTAFDTQYFNPKEIIFDKRHRMSDCLFSLIAAQQKKKILAIPHFKGYIKQIPIDESKSCFGIESKNAKTQMQIANEIFTLNYKR